MIASEVARIINGVMHTNHDVMATAYEHARGDRELYERAVASGEIVEDLA